jgi:hypothetical protein
MCHAAAKNFIGLLICRIFLGMCEGAITAGYVLLFGSSSKITQAGPDS